MITYTINGPILEVRGVGVYSTEDVAAMYLTAMRDPLLPAGGARLVAEPRLEDGLGRGRDG